MEITIRIEFEIEIEGNAQQPDWTSISILENFIWYMKFSKIFIEVLSGCCATFNFIFFFITPYCRIILVSTKFPSPYYARSSDIIFCTESDVINCR